MIAIEFEITEMTNTISKAGQSGGRTMGFRDIKAEIFDRIRSNRWGPGTMLPGEISLAAEFGCARATVNRAMQELSAEGIIERRRKGGSWVRIAPVRQLKFEIPVVRVEIERSGASYSYERLLRAEKPAPRWLVERLELPGGVTMLHVKCLHRANGKPYQLEDRWINLAAVPRAGGEPFTSISPNEWLVAEVPYTKAEVRLSAAKPTARDAKYLGTSVAASLFQTERTTWLAGKPVTNVRLLFAPGYELVASY